MTKKSAILHFGRETVDKPILTGLIREHNVSVNILQASISPEEDGTMFIQVEGEGADVESAFGYLEKLGVRLVFPAKNIIWDDDVCTNCGACVGHCLPKALAIDVDKGEVIFDAEKCIACELCIPACPYGALESVTEHLG